MKHKTTKSGERRAEKLDIDMTVGANVASKAGQFTAEQNNENLPEMVEQMATSKKTVNKAKEVDLSQATTRRDRASGDTVSIKLNSKIYKVLKAVATVAGYPRNDITMTLSTALEDIIKSNGVTIEEVQRHLKGEERKPAPKKMDSKLLESLFGEDD